MQREYHETKEETKNLETPVNIVDISKETYKRKSAETILDNDGRLWLNEKHIC